MDLNHMDDKMKPKAQPELTDALREAVAEGLRGLYGCGRVWSAWNVGTMSQNDFYAAEESDECIDQVMDAMRPHVSAQCAAPDERATGKLHDAIMVLQHDCTGGEQSMYYIAGFNECRFSAAALAAQPVAAQGEPAPWGNTDAAHIRTLRNIHGPLLIARIKRYRQVFGCALAEAKDACEHGRDLNADQTEFVSPPAPVSAPAVAEGWKLVPLKLTQEMIEAWNNSKAEDFKLPNWDCTDYTKDEWAAWKLANATADWEYMLAAAPSAPVGGSQADELKAQLQPTMEARRYCKGGQSWTDWQPMSDEDVARRIGDSSFEFRTRAAAPAPEGQP